MPIIQVKNPNEFDIRIKVETFFGEKSHYINPNSTITVDVMDNDLVLIQAESHFKGRLKGIFFNGINYGNKIKQNINGHNFYEIVYESTKNINIFNMEFPFYFERLM